MKFIVGMPHSGELQLHNWYKANKMKVDFRRQPTLEQECVAWYNKEISDEELMGKLIRTRSNTIIEINPCFMLITKLLEETFPQAQLFYIHKPWAEYKTRQCFAGIFTQIDMNIDEHFALTHNALYEFMLSQTPTIRMMENITEIEGKL